VFVQSEPGDETSAIPQLNILSVCQLFSPRYGFLVAVTGQKRRGAIDVIELRKEVGSINTCASGSSKSSAVGQSALPENSPAPQKAGGTVPILDAVAHNGADEVNLFLLLPVVRL
jgi:hypothetical protein